MRGGNDSRMFRQKGEATLSQQSKGLSQGRGRRHVFRIMKTRSPWAHRAWPGHGNHEGDQSKGTVKGVPVKRRHPGPADSECGGFRQMQRQCLEEEKGHAGSK